MAKQSLKIKAANEYIGEAVLFIETTLKNLGHSGKKLVATVLSCEEVLVQLAIHSTSQDNFIYIDITGNNKKAKVKFTCKGHKITLADTSAVSQIADLSDIDDEQAAVMSSLILKSYTGNIYPSHFCGVNIVTVSLDEKKHNNNPILTSIILGAIVGILLRMLLPQSAATFADTNIFTIIYTLFMNAIKMVVAPVVFFSIAEAMTEFSDFSTFGRIGGKVIVSYFLTTAIAMAVGFVIFSIMKPGDPSLAPAVLEVIGDAATDTTVANISILDTIVGIVPTNFAGAFVRDDMLQIIFMGIIAGIASGLLGEYSEGVQEFIKNGNALFSKITTIIIKTMPVALFCIVANIILTTGAESLLSLLHVFGTVIVGLCAMVVFYILFLSIVGKLNPFKFFFKCKDAFITAFTTCASNATMPSSMKCLDNLGVSKKIYGFSIPLGVNINMDGLGVYYVIITMFMARVFDIQLSGSLMVSLFLSVILLSIGTPGIPGSALTFLAMLFSQIGVAPEAVSYIIIVNTLADFFVTAINVMGDAVVTTVVASNEGLIDLEKYNE